MSIRLTLEGTIKDGVTREAFVDMARRATAFSEEDPGVVTHKFYLSDDGRYFEEDAFTDEAGFFAHVGPATEAGIMDAYLGAVDLERVLVLDPVSDEMKKGLEAWGPSISSWWPASEPPPGPSAQRRCTRRCAESRCG